MSYTIAIHGDAEETAAWDEFVRDEFPEYEKFWVTLVVPVTERPHSVRLRQDGDLPAGRDPEDVAIAQLHYTVLKNLRRAFAVRETEKIDDYQLTLGLSFLVAAQDVAFELLGRTSERGKYDPWLESGRGNSRTGQDARKAWQKRADYPLQWIRDYRNKLLHGRTPPAVDGKLPTRDCLDRYADWRKAAGAPAKHFQPPREILGHAWKETVEYISLAWRNNLL